MKKQSVGKFQPSYQKSRLRFIDSANRAGFQLEHYIHPQTGYEGEQLAMDVAIAGNPDCDTLILCSSGVHGVEGIAGSACQSDFLERMVAGEAGSMAKLKLLFVHAVNPHGFSYWQRTNEHNVDLNRNFIDFDVMLPANYDYEAIHEWLVCENVENDGRITSQLGDYIKQVGMPMFQSILAKGQYSCARGLFYGGREPQWSQIVFKRILAKHVAQAKRVVFLDIHTGLGPAGHGELIFNGDLYSRNYEFTRSVFGRDVTASQQGNAVATYSNGLILNAFETMNPDCLLASATLEYGTVAFEEVVNALRSECWHRYYGSDQVALIQAKERLLKAFTIDDEQWRHDVLSRFHWVMLHAIKSLSVA